MKKFTKLICLAVALLMVLACFAACGGSGDDTTLPKVNNTDDDDEGRNSVKDTVPTDLNFTGKTVTFFVRNDSELWKNEIDVEKTVNDTLYDAIYYRNLTVEDRLGVEIKQVGQAGQYSVSDSWNSTLRNAVLTRSGDYDCAAIYASTGSALAVEGVYYNVIDLPYLNLDQPWWNQTIVDELTLFDTLYFLGGDIAVTETASGICLFYNKELFTEFYQTAGINLYDVVSKGKWTIDYMNELVAGVWTDVNSDGVVSDGDVVGFYNNVANGGNDGSMDAWIPALGIKLTTMVDGYPEFSFYDEHTIEAFEKLKTLSVTNSGTLTTARSATGFQEGNLLFTRGKLNSGSEYRSMEDSYGVLPLPKFDEEQESYYTRFENTASLITVLSTCQEPDVVSATLELMAAESYKQVTPAYFEICLQGKYSDAPEDAEIYDIIVNSFMFEFGFCYSTKSLEGIGSLFRDLDTDLAQTYEANKIKYQTALDTLIDKLDEISFLG